MAQNFVPLKIVANVKQCGSPCCPFLSRALVSSQAVWNTGDGTKWYKNETITSAIVADGIVDLSTGELYKGVFEYCSKLKTARLPESLRKIGDRAFKNCSALVHVDIPSGVNEIGAGAFHGSSIETVTIPEGVVDLPEFIFYKCKSLKSVKLPSSLKTIGENAFHDCSSLTTINNDALEGVTEIGMLAFALCKSLTTFKLPPLLKIIEMYTFHKCGSLSKVDLPPSLEIIEEEAFHGCSHPDLIIDLPETVTTILREALKGCRIRLPTSLSVLTNRGNLIGLLKGVKEVVMSSRVNLGQLVHLIVNTDPTDLAPALTFKFLHSGAPSRARPPISKHVHESFFSLDVSADELKKIDRRSLRRKVVEGFSRKISIYAALLQCKSRDLPKEILYPLLPFLYENLTELMLKDIVTGVGELFGRTVAATGGSRKRAKRGTQCTEE